MHFFESSIITTKDGLHCQVYGNEHPVNSILVKPKYIPTDKVESKALQYRFISGKKMNRLNMWIGKENLRGYIKSFKKEYPEYVFTSPIHNGNRLFFSIPIDKIERIYFPRRGLKELMKMPEGSLDEHLKKVHEFVEFILKSGVDADDLGVTYSTLMGHYLSNLSDINIVIYGKDNYWKVMEYLKTAKHKKLKWKTKEDWLNFYKGRNRFAIFNEEEFLHLMSRKKSEGFFDGTLFILFGAEKESETWFKWGEEKYYDEGLVVFEGIVTDNFSSVVRPGFFGVKDSRILEGSKDVQVSKIVFYSRDYGMIAYPGEKIRACGVLEKVVPRDGEEHYRVVVGYFDGYLDDRREKEFIKVI